MGNNEPLPPPPPPPPPPGPPQQPTQQMPTAPVTQALPQQGFPAAATPPKSSNTGLLIGGGLVIAAAIVGGVLLVSRGGDDKSTPITLAPFSSTTLVVETTLPATLVITVPPTAAPTVPATEPDTGVIEVTDDTNTFSVILPSDLEIDTASIQSTDGFTVPTITAADRLQDYNVDDATFGMSVIAVGPDIGSDAALVMAFLQPPEGTCSGEFEDVEVPTAVGTGNRVTLTQCGELSGQKVLMVVQLADRPVVLGIYLQGLGAIESMQELAQAILESILVL